MQLMTTDQLLGPQRFIGLGGVNNIFSHVSLILVATSSIFAKSLLTNFFAPFLAARGPDFLFCFLYHWHSELVGHTCTPCFWHRMRGFLEARCSWEPGSSLTTGKFSLFCLLPKVSGANVCWTEHDSYLSFSQKSSDWHFLAWPQPSQATQYSPGMESPKGYPTRK